MTGPDPIPSQEITPPKTYWSRRTFIRAGIVAASVTLTGVAYRRWNGMDMVSVEPPAVSDLTVAPATADAIAQGFVVDEPRTSMMNITNYNNFYEFSTNKEAVARLAAGFVSRPWQVAVQGMVHKPRVFGLEELLRIRPVEERVYRMRCVEGWSMVIPWNGFPLSKLLSMVEPMGSARFVAFESLHDPSRFPGQRGDVLAWPYVEGLRMDEAMHPLTILAIGLYGREMPAQNGAPVRLVVPWKYGFKGIKSIVKITLTSSMPPTTWNMAASREYGFYSNVNPDVPHPRWSQATEQRIDESGRRATLMFNGYAEQVGHLYTGMDLRANY